MCFRISILLDLNDVFNVDSNTLGLLFIFAASVTFTPGPANLALLGYSVQLGVKNTLPILAGVSFGFTLVTAAICIGLGSVFKEFPEIALGIKVVGSVYILYLAKQLWHAGDNEIKQPDISASSGFLKGSLIHPLSPKAWLMMLTAYGQFVNADSVVIDSLWLAAAFFITGLLANSTWTLSGTMLNKHLKSPKTRKTVFSILAGTLVLLTAALWLS